MPCCCGGGRRKREAVVPHFKTSETPCPQTEWRQVIEEGISQNEKDPAMSVNAIQTAFYRRYSGEAKFLVTCAANQSKAVSQ